MTVDVDAGGEGHVGADLDEARADLGVQDVQAQPGDEDLAGLEREPRLVGGLARGGTTGPSPAPGR